MSPIHSVAVPPGEGPDGGSGSRATATRAVAPDLARGLMLLLIALAHARILHPGGAALGLPGGGGVLGRTVQAVMTLVVDGRAHPLFAVLFGYGLVQITRRCRSDAEADRVLRRRGRWLVVFGVAHVLLLYAGDILTAYGLVALLLASAVRWSARALTAVAVPAAVAGAVWFAVVQVALVASGPEILPSDPTVAAMARAASLLSSAPMNALLSTAPLLIGILAARAGVFDAPDRFRPVLVRVTAFGVPTAVLGALPITAQAMGWWRPPTPVVEGAASMLHTLTGIAGGVSYVAVFLLLSSRVRRGPVIVALASAGARSMTCYLAQSVGWFLLAEPYLGDLGGGLGPATAAAVGALIWVATVLAADMMRRAHTSGPAEAAMRTFTRRGHRTNPGAAR